MAAVIEIETSEIETVGCITTTKKSKKKKWKWDDEMIQSLVNALKTTKVFVSLIQSISALIR